LAEHLDQGIVDDFHHHLARRNAAQDFLTNGFLSGLFDEIARDRQGDVGFQQRQAHFAHGFLDVGFLQRTAPGQPVENI
jgi:hypothetical protein